MSVSHRTRGLFCALKDLGLSVCSRTCPGMFANILVPLDGSALSEHALPMAQHLARSSDTVLHLLQVISLRPELDALRGSGSESVTVLEMAQDAARRLREAQTARGQAYLEGLAVPLRTPASLSPRPSGRGPQTKISSRTPRNTRSTSSS